MCTKRKKEGWKQGKKEIKSVIRVKHSRRMTELMSKKTAPKRDWKLRKERRRLKKKSVIKNNEPMNGLMEET